MYYCMYRPKQTILKLNSSPAPHQIFSLPFLPLLFINFSISSIVYLIYVGIISTTHAPQQKA